MHAEDVARFIFEFCSSPRVAEVYNIGGGKANSCSIIEAFALIAAHTGKTQRYTYVHEPRAGDHICYYSDLRKMKNHYPNWDVAKSLDDTLGEIVEAWRHRAPLSSS
jgi:CDP-paratose 2-epimerase